MAHSTEDVKLVNPGDRERDVVEDHGYNRMQIVTSQGYVELVNGDGDECVEQHPAMQLPFRHPGHFVVLRPHRHLLVQVDGMDAEDFVKPMEPGPLAAIECAPGGLH